MVTDKVTTWANFYEVAYRRLGGGGGGGWEEHVELDVAAQDSGVVLVLLHFPTKAFVA